VTITLVEAGSSLLGPFDKVLQDYAYLLFRKRQIHVQLDTAVLGVEDYNGPDENHHLYHFPGKRAKLSNGTYIEFGTMVWSAGLAPRTFTEELVQNNPLIQLHPKSKRIYVDDYLRVINYEGTIWAMGDAAVNYHGDIPLPQLAQVARQQGIYLAKILSGSIKESETLAPFSFFSLGSMAFLGDLKGVYDGSTAGPLTKNHHHPKAPFLKGIAALVLWRFAYWGRQTSIANKILIPIHWFKTFFFGRDTSRY
jgi:NADH dehydrogenase FAD-containing subunit